MAKREVITHTKLKRLKRSLGLEDWGALGVLEALWHLTAREARLGDIGKLLNEDIADAIGWRTDPDALISALVSSGWLDEDPKHRLVVHDWAEHSDDTLHAQVARKREWFASGAAPRLSRLNSNERAAAAAFYATEPIEETTGTQAQTTEALPDYSESLLGESGSTPTRQEVPKPSTMPCHAITTPQPPEPSGGGNGKEPDFDSPWKPYHASLFKYFGRDPWPEEWDQIHDWLLGWEKRGDLPPPAVWDVYCHDCNESCRKATKFNPKTTKPLANFMADIFSERRES